MIQSRVRVAFPGDRPGEAMAIPGPEAERTRAKRGCLGCHLHRDALEADVLILEESWASEADLERRLRSPDYRQLLLVKELKKAPPEVSFDAVARSSGFETIEKARS